jgi:hypothetical protein
MLRQDVDYIIHVPYGSGGFDIAQSFDEVKQDVVRDCTR